MSVSDLVSKVNQLDRSPLRISRPFSKNSDKEENDIKNNNRPMNRPRNPKFKPCPYCEKHGKPGRYHPEAECLLKARFTQGKGNTATGNANTVNNSVEKSFKYANNTELEEILNRELNPKN